MDLAPDFDEFIGSLIAHGVEFLIVGAYALAFHGAPRYTGDIDILIRPALDNASRTLAAIAAFGFPAADLTAGDLIDSRRMLEMGVEPVQIHVMSSITGVVHVALGGGDQALSWLDKAVEDMASWLTMFGKSDPRLDPIRSEPRFADLLRRMRLDR
jgi:hypothetical protein